MLVAVTVPLASASCSALLSVACAVTVNGPGGTLGMTSWPATSVHPRKARNSLASVMKTTALAMGALAASLSTTVARTLPTVRRIAAATFFTIASSARVAVPGKEDVAVVPSSALRAREAHEPTRLSRVLQIQLGTGQDRARVVAVRGRDAERGRGEEGDGEG